MDNTLLSQIPVEKRKYVANIYKDSIYGAGIWAELKKGNQYAFRSDYSGSMHVIYKNTIEEVIKELDKIEKCNCKYCKGW